MVNKHVLEAFDDPFFQQIGVVFFEQHFLFELEGRRRTVGLIRRLWGSKKCI